MNRNLRFTRSTKFIFARCWYTYASRNASTGKDVKRFYKNVSIAQAEGGEFEVNLDQMKLKTPLGSLVRVPTRPLALAVANEWNAQQDVIKRHTMYLTTLCNAVIDNPTQTSKEIKIDGMLDFLETDTICYRMEEPEELHEFLKKHWDPVLTWARNRYGVIMTPTTGLGVPDIPDSTKDVFRQHLLSQNDWSIAGYQQAIEVTKSMILAFALMDRYLDVPLTLKLSRLEQLFQTEIWGNVEWHHNIEQQAQQARLAAATMFVHLNSEKTSHKQKITQHTIS